MGSVGEVFRIESVPGKGKGAIAAKAIASGTLILSEAPLFTTESLSDPENIEKDLGRIVKSLPKDGQRAFLSLHNNYAGQGDPFSNIIRSNGYPLGPNSEIGGIFPQVARINHSCLPNAQHAYDTKRSQMLVHAIRDIAEGEEITLSYTTGGPSEVRLRTLKQYFGFDCACELCSLPSEKLEASDARLRRAGELDEAIGNSKRVRHQPELALADCKSLLDVYREEGIFDLRLPRLYHDAFQICAMHSDAARAKVFAERSCEARIRCEGEDSPAVAEERELVAKPQSFENWGVTKKWNSTANGVPSELQGERFERWLWRQA